MLSVCAVAQIVHAIAHFAIADQLAGGPATAAEIAARCHMDPLATEPLLQACGSLGLVLEPPERVSTASLAPRWRGMRSRLSVVGGDVLSPVPPADLYLLKYILHDWEAATCVRILASCRRALQPDGRVVVIEMQLEEPRRPLFAPAQPAVLVAPPGRERTLPEYEELYLEAGLRLLSTASTRSGRLVLQAVPVW